MRRGQGGEWTQARRTDPRARVSTRRPVARSQGARGRGAPPSASSVFSARASGVWGLHPGKGLGGPFGGGVRGLALASSSGSSPSLSGSRSPSALAGPMECPASNLNLPPTRRPCPRRVGVPRGPGPEGFRRGRTPRVSTGPWERAAPAHRGPPAGALPRRRLRPVSRCRGFPAPSSDVAVGSTPCLFSPFFSFFFSFYLSRPV